MRINVLGPFEVRSEDRVVALAGMKQRVLLSSLALSSRTAVPIGVLINMLWGETPPATARAKVHAHVSEIRKALGGSHDGQHPGGWPVVTCQGGYQLSGDVDLDSWEFEISARRARQALRLGQYAQGSELFARALAMWRGPALADVESDAIQAAAKALNEERMLVIEGKAEADLQLGWYDEVVAELGQVAAANPLRERLRGASELTFRLETGRTHQIRVHLAALGHPIVNDPLYGRPDSRLPLAGQALHAWRLRFKHPRTKQMIALESEPPPEYLATLEMFRPSTSSG